MVTAISVLDNKLKTKVHWKKSKGFLDHILSFGALGVVKSVQLEIVPRYAIVKCIYTGLDFNHLETSDNLNKLINDWEFTSFHTTWNRNSKNSVTVGKIITEYVNVKFDWGYKNFCKPSLPGLPKSTLVEKMKLGKYSKAEYSTGSGVGWWNEKIFDAEPNWVQKANR